MDAALIGIGGTLFGALVGGWITYRFSIEIAKRQVFNQAALSFRSAFSDELTVLTTTSEDPYYILNKANPKHVSAGFEFRWVLSSRERTLFDATWLKFYCDEHGGVVPALEKYSNLLSDEESGIPKKERRQVAIDRINELLKFAEPK